MGNPFLASCMPWFPHGQGIPWTFWTTEMYNFLSKCISIFFFLVLKESFYVFVLSVQILELLLWTAIGQCLLLIKVCYTLISLIVCVCVCVTNVLPKLFQLVYCKNAVSNWQRKKLVSFIFYADVPLKLFRARLRQFLRGRAGMLGRLNHRGSVSKAQMWSRHQHPLTFNRG